MADPTTPTTPAAPATAAQPDFLKQLAAALAAVGAGIGGKAIANAQGNPLTQAVPPQVSQLLDQSVQRQAYQNPLFQATTQGVYDMLPDFAKTGTSLSGTLSNVAPPAQAQGSSGPGLGTAAALGGGAGLAALLSKLGGGGSGAGGDLSKVFDAIKKKFGGQPGDFTGPINQPNWQGPTNDPLWQGPGNQPDWQGSSDPMLPSDPGVYYGETGGGASPTDPSGGSGTGPGMQAFYDWLQSQGGGSGTADPPDPGPLWGG